MDGPLIVLGEWPSWMLLKHLPMLFFVFCFGAAAGSFLNVVVYRLPAGMSVISPPSRCPTCGAKLKFFRENLPILGWFMIRGKCRYCGVRVSPQYMIVELGVALLSTLLYCALYVVQPHGAGPSAMGEWIQGIGSDWWYFNEFLPTMPAFFALLFLLIGLVGMTLIDARTFTIPIQIPLFVTITAFIAWPLQAMMPLSVRPSTTWPIPSVDWQWFFVGTGGIIGAVIAVLLLRVGILKQSFADYYEYVSEQQAVGDYPHARREMIVEMTFLLPCVVGMISGYFLGMMRGGECPPVVLQAVGASFLGYLVGGGLIWGVRVLGSLAFGKEAMGLGDVHLLAAVGAVLGWFDPILVFFIAPFSGLLWHILSKGLGSVVRSARRELPYGPHLAVATFLLFVGRYVVQWVWSMVLPGVPFPGSGLCP